MRTAKDVAAVAEVENEYKWPAILLGVGLVIHLLRAFFLAGPAGVAGAVVGIGVIVSIQVVLGVIACMLAGRITGADFGLLWPGCVKLAAIFVLPGAVAMLIPWACVGFIVVLLLYWGMLEQLFKLDPVETVVTVVIMWVVNAGAVLLAVLAVAALTGPPV